MNDVTKNTDTAVELPDLAIFDGMQKAQEDGLDVEIRGPDNKKLGFSIRIAGPDSIRQRRAVEKMAAERMASDDPTPLSPQDLYDRQTRGLASSTISWTPFKMDGGVYELTEENAYKLYTRFAFIRDQVAERAGRRSAFFASLSSDAE